MAGDFGPNLAALIAYLTVVCRMPRRVVLALLEQGLGIRLSLGSVQSSWEEEGEALADPCAELEKQLPHEPVINSDETGYRTEGEKRWLWAFVASIFVVYKAALTRGTEVLVQMLGSIFAGTLCSDRYQAYFSYHKGSMQLFGLTSNETSSEFRKSQKPPMPSGSAATRWRCTRACSGCGIVFVTDRGAVTVQSHVNS